MVIRKILTAAFAAAVVLLSSNSGECAKPIPGPGGGYLCTSSVQGQAPEPKKVQSAIPETEQAKASSMPELEARAQKVAYEATAAKADEAKVRYMLIGGKPHKVTIGTSGHVVAVSEIAEMPKVLAPTPVKKVVAEAPRYQAAMASAIPVSQAEYAPPTAPAAKVTDNGEIRNGNGTQRQVMNDLGVLVWEDILNEFQLDEGNVSQRRKGTVWKSSLPQGLWEPYGVEFKKGPSTVFYGEVNAGFYPDPKNTRFYRAVGRVPNATQLFEAAVVPVENQKPGKKTRRVAVFVDGVCPTDTKFNMTDICPAENMADRGRLPWGDFEGRVGELLSGRTLERDPKFAATFVTANGTAVSQLTSAILDEGQRDQLLREKLGLPLYKVEPSRYVYFAIRGKGADRTIARLMAEDAGINWGDQWVRSLGGGYPPSPIGSGISAFIGLGKSIVTPSKMPRLTTQQRESLRSVETVPVAYDNGRGYGGSIGKSPSYTASTYAPSNAGGRQLSSDEFLRQSSGEWANADPSGWLYHPKNNLAGELQKSVMGFGGERYKEVKGTARTSSWYNNSAVLPEFLGFEPIPGKSWVNPGFAVATSGYRGKFKDLEGRNWPYKGNRAGIGPAVAAGFNFDDGSWMQITGAMTFGNKTNPQGANLARVGSTQYEAQIEYGKDWLVTGELSWFPGFKLGIFGDNRQIQSAGNLKVVRTMGDEVQISATLTNMRQSTAPGVFVELLRGGVWAGASLDDIRFSWGVGGNPVKAIDYLSELRYRSFIEELPKGCLPQDALGYK